jgi:hypothetical protein
MSEITKFILGDCAVMRKKVYLSGADQRALLIDAVTVLRPTSKVLVITNNQLKFDNEYIIFTFNEF